MKNASLFIFLFLAVFFSGNTARGADGTDLAIKPDHHDFGFLTAGSTSTPAIFTITNNGSEEAVLTEISVSNETAYSVEVEDGPKPCGKGLPTLTAGESCTFSVRFRPFAAGVISGSLVIGSDSPGSSILVAPLTGFGIACGC